MFTLKWDLARSTAELLREEWAETDAIEHLAVVLIQPRNLDDWLLQVIVDYFSEAAIRPGQSHLVGEILVITGDPRSLGPNDLVEILDEVFAARDAFESVYGVFALVNDLDLLRDPLVCVLHVVVPEVSLDCSFHESIGYCESSQVLVYDFIAV